MADRPVLVCMTGSLAGQVFPVAEGGMELGRAPENDVVVQDDGVSRFHARILFDNGSLWLRDAGSRNGVLVNGQRVADHRALRVGDRIAMGASEFEVRWEGEVEEGTSPASPAQRNGQAGRRRWYWPFE